jgi:hypothetical protein
MILRHQKSWIFVVICSYLLATTVYAEDGSMEGQSKQEQKKVEENSESLNSSEEITISDSPSAETPNSNQFEKEQPIVKQDKLEKKSDSATVTNEKAEEEVLPLNPWFVPFATDHSEEAKQKPKLEQPSVEQQYPVNSHTSAVERFADSDIDSGITAERIEIIPIPPREKKVILNKMQLQRLRLAERHRKRLIFEQKKDIRRKFPKDPRGRYELRLCSVNADNFGTVAAVGKIARFNAPKFKEWTSELVRVIMVAKCDVVLLQGIIGADYQVAKEGVAFLARKVELGKGELWDYYIAESNHRLVRNAVIVKRKVGEVQNIISHNDLLLPRITDFTTAKFYRGPLELYFKTGQQGDSNRRELIVFNFSFQDALRNELNEPEKPRMQMAEALRQLVDLRVKESSVRNPAIIIAVGDRGAIRNKPSAQILEGRFQLTDLKPEIGCILNAEEKIECEKKVTHAKLLFSVINEGLISRKLRSKRFDGKILSRDESDIEREIAKKRKYQSVLTSDIYMLQRDLPLAWKHHNVAYQFRSGVVDVKYGRKNSPLLWVELNW